MSKVTYDDVVALVKEIEVGANDKKRTIEDIPNKKVKEMIINGSEMAISAGVTPVLLSWGSAMTGAMIGSAGGVGTGIAATSLVTMGITGSVTGAAAGSAIPVVGTIVGAGVGLGLGLLASTKIKEKKVKLMKDVLAKQDTVISVFKKEAEELKEKYGKEVEQNERYKYIIGVLMANEELLKYA